MIPRRLFGWLLPKSQPLHEIYGPEAALGPPERIAVFPDDYRLPDVGWSPTGEAVFLTTPFTWPDGDKPGCEFNALYVFDENGDLKRHTIVPLGPREALDEERAKDSYQELLDSVSPLKREKIEVKPFSIEHDGTEFGFIPSPSEDGEMWWVEVMPGNSIAFTPPWDDGGYDT